MCNEECVGRLVWLQKSCGTPLPRPLPLNGREEAALNAITIGNLTKTIKTKIDMLFDNLPPDLSGG